MSPKTKKKADKVKNNSPKEGNKKKKNSENPLQPPNKNDVKVKTEESLFKANKWFFIVAGVLGILIIISAIYTIYDSETVDNFFSKDSCNYEGVTYMLDESFEAEDGCNLCTCVEGKVECTELACTEPASPPDRDSVDTSESPVYDPADQDQYLNVSLDCNKENLSLNTVMKTSLPYGVQVELEEEYANESECVFEFTYLNSVLQLGKGVGAYGPFEVTDTDIIEDVPTATTANLVRLLMNREYEYAETACDFFGLDSEEMCTWYKYGTVQNEDSALFTVGISDSGEDMYNIADLIIPASDDDRSEEILDVFDYVVKNTTLK